MKQIWLVTGGAGFIGSNFIRYVLVHDAHVNIVNLDALTYAGTMKNLENLPDHTRHTFVEGNITDIALLEKLFAEYAFSTVVHFAAESHVDRSITGPRNFIESNIVGTFNLLEAVRKGRLGRNDIRFHHVSTDEVFGTLSPDDPPFTEQTPYDPNSVYSASKAASDHLVRAYHRTYGLQTTISNCSNNYGPYQFPEKLIPLIILNAIQDKPLPIYGDGKQIRDWLYVEDHCEAIFQIIKKGVAGDTYLIGGENQTTNISIVEMICSILDEILPRSSGDAYSELISFVKDRPGHDRRYDIDCSRIKEKLGWQSQTDLQQGLEKTIRWYLTHTAWLEEIVSDDEFHVWLETNYSHRENGGLT